jgi:hypothetical protein
MERPNRFRRIVLHSAYRTIHFPCSHFIGIVRPQQIDGGLALMSVFRCTLASVDLLEPTLADIDSPRSAIHRIN